MPLGVERVFELGHLVGLERSNSGLDVSGVLLEFHTEGLGFEDGLKLVVDVGFAQCLLDDQLLLSLVCVDGQIIRRSVGATDTLDPPVRRLDLEVPAVLSRKCDQTV